MVIVKLYFLMKNTQRAYLYKLFSPHTSYTTYTKTHTEERHSHGLCLNKLKLLAGYSVSRLTHVFLGTECLLFKQINAETPSCQPAPVDLLQRVINDLCSAKQDTEEVLRK